MTSEAKKAQSHTYYLRHKEEIAAKRHAYYMTHKVEHRNTVENVRLAHLRCNAKKQAKVVETQLMLVSIIPAAGTKDYRE